MSYEKNLRTCEMCRNFLPEEGKSRGWCCWSKPSQIPKWLVPYVSHKLNAIAMSKKVGRVHRSDTGCGVWEAREAD